MNVLEIGSRPSKKELLCVLVRQIRLTYSICQVL